MTQAQGLSEKTYFGTTVNYARKTCFSSSTDEPLRRDVQQDVEERVCRTRGGQPLRQEPLSRRRRQQIDARLRKKMRHYDVTRFRNSTKILKMHLRF